MGLPCFSIMRIEKQGDFLWREKEMEKEMEQAKEKEKEKEKKMEKAKEMEKKMDVEISKMVNAIAARLG